MILIVPDVHEQIRKLVKILQKYDYVSLVIFLGDFMDTFLGLTPETEETIMWLRDNLKNPKYKFCMGNHDTHYAFPIEQVMCSGYSRQKQFLYTKHLLNNATRPLIRNIKLFHWAGDWLCSHAGLHPNYLHPMHGYDKQALSEMEERALENLWFGQVDPLFSVGRSRGGWAKVGGVTWLDFNDEFVPIPGLNQLVGHTRGTEIRTNDTGASMNSCIDTHLRHVALVDEEHSILDVVRVYGTRAIRVVKTGRGKNKAETKNFDTFSIEVSNDEEKTWQVALADVKPYDLRKELKSFLLSSEDDFIDTPDFKL